MVLTAHKFKSMLKNYWSKLIDEEESEVLIFLAFMFLSKMSTPIPSPDEKDWGLR